MSDISQINLDGIDYNIKDSNARSNITSLNTNIITLSNTIRNISSNLTENINKVDDKVDTLQTTVSNISDSLNNKLDLNTTSPQTVKGKITF